MKKLVPITHGDICYGMLHYQNGCVRSLEVLPVRTNFSLSHNVDCRSSEVDHCHFDRLRVLQKI
jgi:hypothetical protein